jgi:hypothetical protein
MAKNTTFQLDITSAGLEILQSMAMQPVDKAASAIANRAQSMASSMSGENITFGTGSRVGVIKTGKRAIATVAAVDADDKHRSYIAHTALVKALDAGRAN